MAGTPRAATKAAARMSSPQPTAALYSVSSRNGSVRSQSRPLFAQPPPPHPPPMLHVPPPPPLPPPNGSNQLTTEEEAVYTEPGVASYTEPYRAMRYSPYYGYGPVLSEIENSLMKNYPQHVSGKSSFVSNHLI